MAKSISKKSKTKLKTIKKLSQTDHTEQKCENIVRNIINLCNAKTKSDNEPPNKQKTKIPKK